MGLYIAKTNTLQYEDFYYKKYIRDLTREEFEEARDIVVAMWSGVLELWECLDSETKQRKRSLALSLLVAWYLVDLYPDRVTGGITSGGGLGVSGKSIRDVSIQYRDLNANLPQVYAALSTNQFGIKVADLLRYAPEMMGVYG